MTKAQLEKYARKLEDLLLDMPEPGGEMPPDQYTDWCTGADGTGKQPYPKQRNRQCSIGYHAECSDPAGESCGCPCHEMPVKRLERFL